MMNTQYYAKLSDLQIGDEVAVYSGKDYDEPKIVKVEKRTATQVTLEGGLRFSQRSQYSNPTQLGVSQYVRKDLITAERARQIIAQRKIRHEIRALQHELESYSWRGLELEQLKQVSALLASFKAAAEQPAA